jgi:hypothetical protein
MRTLRTTLIFCLGLILGAIAAYSFFLWKRGPQPVTQVYPGFGVLPYLQPGQVLVWQSAPGQPAFTINWDDSPCEISGPIASAPVSNIPTATCKIKKNLPAGENVSYYFTPQPPSGQTPMSPVEPLGPGTTPCYGCTSVIMSPPSDTMVKPIADLQSGHQTTTQNGPVKPSDGFPGLVIVSCPASGITLQPTTIQAAIPFGGTDAQVMWGPGGGATLTATPPSFTNASPKCTKNGANWTCTFKSGQDYSNVTYQIGANGQYCGTAPAKGTVKSPN